MDLNQTKLSKSEWEGIEVPITENEKAVLSLIKSGYSNIDIRHNNNQSLISFIKITQTPEIETFIYKTYFQPLFEKMVKDFIKKDDAARAYYTEALTVLAAEAKKPPNSKDIIRLDNMKQNIEGQKHRMVDFFIVDLCRNALHSLYMNTNQYAADVYTIVHLFGSTIPGINKFVLQFAKKLVKRIETGVADKLIPDMIHNAQMIIEKNANILKYADITLFDHQKQLFQLFGPNVDKEIPKLVLYIAPTGTGKTMSPIGLSENCRVIFVCMARHVGLALARASISAEKRIAFAFGCETASDIRLHYFAAVDYSRNRKTGGIYKVDNSNGCKVEIMICDIKSYLTAMHYMLAFNPESNIVTFWDEPTITMDYEDHELHPIIHDNWRKNRISKMVLSCATLPFEDEIQDTIDDFKSRFDMAEIHSISTYDCKKTITILNKEGKPALPHLLFASYDQIQLSVTHCEKMKSLMRYFDLAEIVRFIEYVNHSGYLPERYTMKMYFRTISDINMNSIKTYYLIVLKNVLPEKWSELYDYMTSKQKPMFEKYVSPFELRKIKSHDPSSLSSSSMGNPISRMSSLQPHANSMAIPVVSDIQSNPFAGMLITTEDAHTLTDGPTIYLAENIENVGKFLLKNSNIPTKVLESVIEKIEYNNMIQRKIDKIQSEIDLKEGKVTTDKTAKPDKKRDIKTGETSRELDKLTDTINTMRTQIVLTNVESAYIPNTRNHQTIWVKGGKIVENAFVANIDDDSIREIMSLSVSNQFKLLLLLGIGMFIKDDKKEYTQYMEIMKRLATQERLFLIIASSDYIYGTNYQFCHGFIGKDLDNLTQQKTIQSAGRVGRGNVQNNYTVRFRDNAIIVQLFLPSQRNIEAEKMSALMNTISGEEEDVVDIYA